MEASVRNGNITTSTSSSSSIMGSNGDTEIQVPVGKNGGLKPLNRKQHEAQLEQLQHHITKREEERGSSQDALRKIRDKLGEVRSRREAIGEERTRVDERLTEVNKKVQDKREQVQKVRSGMLYSNEELILEQIQKLEIQLERNHFKPSEEKKIILEINRLKRSKNSLKDFNLLKSELDTLRTAQKDIREKRDELFRDRGDVKRLEDGLKKESREIKEKIDTLKSDIDNLWLEKKELVNEFRALEAKHRQLQYERREEYRQKRKEDKAAREELKFRELEEIRANAEPFEEERNLCTNLISYCEKFDSNVNNSNGNNASNNQQQSNYLCVPSGSRRNSSNSRRGSENAEGDSVYSTPVGASPATTPIDDGCFFYKKPLNDDALQFPVNQKQNKKKKKRNSFNKANKPLTHNPETFAQFLSLNLKPPANTNEVSSIIVELKSKLKHLEEQAILIKNSRKNGTLEVNIIHSSDMHHSPEKQEVKIVTPIETADFRSDGGIVSEAFPSLPEPAINFSFSSATKA